MPRNVWAFFDRICGKRPSFFFLKIKFRLISTIKQLVQRRTVFLRDRIDDHVVYDGVRYVRFVATNRVSFFYFSSEISGLPWWFFNRSRIEREIGVASQAKSFSFPNQLKQRSYSAVRIYFFQFEYILCCVLRYSVSIVDFYWLIQSIHSENKQENKQIFCIDN